MNATEFETSLLEAADRVGIIEGALRKTAAATPDGFARETALGLVGQLSAARHSIRASVLRNQETEQSPPRRLVLPAEGSIEVPGGLHVDLRSRTVTVDGRRAELSGNEYALLRLFAADPQRVFTKEELYRDVWGITSKNGVQTRTLDTTVSRLRRKLDPDGTRFIHVCWGVGYSLIDRASVAGVSA